MDDYRKHYKIDNATLQVSHANIFSKLGPFSKTSRNLYTDLALTTIGPNHKDPDYCPPHHHDHFQFFYTNTETPCRHLLGKQEFFNYRGDVTFVPPAFAHHISVCKSGVHAGYMFNVQCEYIYFSAPEKVRKFLFDASYLLRWLRGGGASALIFSLPEQARGRADELCAELFKVEFMIREQADKRLFPLDEKLSAPFYALAGELFGLMCDGFYAACTPAELKALEKYRPIMLSSLGFIHENFSRPIKMSDVCDNAGLKVSRFSELFRDIIGLTVNDYINFIRIARARVLVASTTKPLSEIGSLCGFTNQTHFGRVFKDFSGCTPRTYKTEHAFEIE